MNTNTRFSEFLSFAYRVLRLWFGDPKTRIPRYIIVASIPLIASPVWQALLFAYLEETLNWDTTDIEKADRAIFWSGWVLFVVGIALFLFVRTSSVSDVDQGRLSPSIAKTLSTLIVDLLRMLYVLGSDEGLSANKDRFQHFIALADQHLDDFRVQVARSATRFPPDLLESIDHIEKKCTWVLGQVKRSEDVTFDLKKCFSSMKRATDQAYTVFATGLPDELARAEDAVEAAFGTSSADERPGSLENLRLRLSIQSELLARQANDGPIQTIAHDTAQDYSLHYFLIDRRLLVTPGQINVKNSSF